MTIGYVIIWYNLGHFSLGLAFVRVFFWFFLFIFGGPCYYTRVGEQTIKSMNKH